jgi:hypothetical protein
MKTLAFTLRAALVLSLAMLGGLPAQGAIRSNLFGRNSRSMMGMGDSGAGEYFTMTPGIKSFKAKLKAIGSVGYASGGNRFQMNFSRNQPRSMSSNNGRMSFVNMRGGGMRMFMRTLKGAKVGKPMTVFPATGILAERGGAPTPTSFKFTGFDGVNFTREQLLNDVPLYGDSLAKLIDSGFGSIQLILARLAVALANQQDPGAFDALGANYVASTLTTAAGGIISGYPNSSVTRTVLTSPFDLLQFIDPLIYNRDLNGDGENNFADYRLYLSLRKAIVSNAETILRILNGLDGAITTEDIRDLLQDAVDLRPSAGFVPVDPSQPGTIAFVESATSVLENAGTTYIYLERKDGSLGAATATVELGASTSPDPHSFVFAKQTVKWADGEAGPKPVALRVVDDRIEEDGDVIVGLAITSTTGITPPSVGIFTDVNIIDNDAAASDSAIAVARNTNLVIEYSWPRAQKDLDTFTTFEASYQVGYRYSASARYAPYMAWSGDDTTTGGKEIVVIDLDSAIADGLLNPFTVSCQADWYHQQNSLGTDFGSHGLATLTVYFRDKVTGKTSPKAVLDQGIFPNTYQTIAGPGGVSANPLFDHATTDVADIDINYDSSNGTVEFTLTPILPGS